MEGLMSSFSKAMTSLDNIFVKAKDFVCKHSDTISFAGMLGPAPIIFVGLMGYSIIHDRNFSTYLDLTSSVRDQAYDKARGPEGLKPNDIFTACKDSLCAALAVEPHPGKIMD